MKPTLARALWLSAAVSMTVPGCANDRPDNRPQAETRAEQSGDSTASNSDPATTDPQPTSGEVKTEAKDRPDMDAPEEAPRLAAAEQAQAATGAAAIPVDSSRMGAAKTSRGGPIAGLRGRAAYPARPAGPAHIPPADFNSANTEDYQNYGTNPMVDTAEDHLSTFAIDVDTASYAIARRKITEGQVPPADAVRVEEFVNYFKYDYAGPTDGAPFAVHMEMAPSPFARGKHILRVGVQGKKLSVAERKPSHLVFLVDVSGSMSSPDKLGLAKRALRILVDNLKDSDTVALVTYAGNTRVVLEPTGVSQKARIMSAIEDLSAGGSTAMASGIELSYQLAAKNLGRDSESRVIVLSDGDANVGNTDHRSILNMIAGKVKEGVTLTTIGFGMGNYKDTMMEQLANKGNGNYYYLDSLSEAKKVFQEQLGGTLEVIAKDVKIQVDFDQDAVSRYRLIGYENRDIADIDFRNDKVDAGEIGAGHTVTAMYEVELNKPDAVPVTVRVRAKQPRGTKASERAYAFDLANAHKSFDGAPSDFRFATAVMAAAEILRRSPYANEWSVDKIITIARGASSNDNSERQEFIALMSMVRPMRNQLTAVR